MHMYQLKWQRPTHYPDGHPRVLMALLGAEVVAAIQSSSILWQPNPGLRDFLSEKESWEMTQP